MAEVVLGAALDKLVINDSIVAEAFPVRQVGSQDWPEKQLPVDRRENWPVINGWLLLCPRP